MALDVSRFRPGRTPPPTPRPDPELTRLLRAWSGGDGEAAEAAIRSVYRRLRALASHLLSREGRAPTLQATALVHELFLRLSPERQPQWRDRRHFFAIAARVMRQILVDQARRRNRLRRGGDRQRVELRPGLASRQPSDDEVLAVHGALRRLEERHPELARVVELRFFMGLTVSEAAEVTGSSTATVGRRWRHAKAWLYRDLRGGAPGHGAPS